MRKEFTHLHKRGTCFGFATSVWGGGGVGSRSEGGSLFARILRLSDYDRCQDWCRWTVGPTMQKNVQLKYLRFPNISFDLKQIEIHKVASTDSVQIRTKETYSRKKHAFWSTDQAINQSKHSTPLRLTFCLLGNVAWFCRLLILFKINLFKNLLQKYHQHVTQFGSRSGPTLCRA